MKRVWTIGRKGDRYRTAIRLLFGYRIHIFWRGDRDGAHHDHPNDFWTFPLRGYWEEYWDEKTGSCYGLQYVKPWRWHFREAEYRHRVLGHREQDGQYLGGFITLVREGPERRSWGFWVWNLEDHQWDWVYWRIYLGEENRVETPATDSESAEG